MTGYASTYVAVCRGFGLDEHDIRGAVTSDGPVEEVFDPGPSGKRYERLLDRLAGSTTGVDLSAGTDDETLATELRVALAAAGREDAAEALGDGSPDVLDRLAAVEQGLLADDYRVVRLADGERGRGWRFLVVEPHRLAGVREQFGPAVSIDGRSVLHDDQPADRSVDPSELLPDRAHRFEPYRDSPGGGPKRIVSDVGVDDVLHSVRGDDRGDGTTESEPPALEGGTVDRALEAPPSEPAGPALDEPPIEAPGEVAEEPIVAGGTVDEDPIVAPGHVGLGTNTGDGRSPSALAEPERRPALDEPPSEPAGPALNEPPIAASGRVEEEPIVARGTVDEAPIVAPGSVSSPSADGTDPDDGRTTDGDDARSA
ncbi:hypothetical protein [Haloarchaeobius sp. HRN-SO-5]|uniref:hypothetical protein n=1 Tax=Haloarchaeobius sp. HRN-SO-5 TaxID=3446118 RepID=UPI003EBA7E78